MKETIRKFTQTAEMKAGIFNRVRAHRYFSISILVMAVVLAACVHVWQRFRVIELVKEVSQLQAENKSLVDDCKKVNSEIASLMMASRVEQYAMDTLGMAPVTADHLYTLIRQERKPVEPDELAVMVAAIKRVADYVPAITESQANAGELQGIRFDSTAVEGEGK
jgi:cell division protein FtsL